MASARAAGDMGSGPVVASTWAPDFALSPAEVTAPFAVFARFSVAAGEKNEVIVLFDIGSLGTNVKAGEEVKKRREATPDKKKEKESSDSVRIKCTVSKGICCTDFSTKARGLGK